MISEREYCLQASRTVHSFDNIKKNVQVSGHLQHLMRSYDTFRWIAFGFGLAALLLSPLMLAAAVYRQMSRRRQGMKIHSTEAAAIILNPPLHAE